MKITETTVGIAFIIGLTIGGFLVGIHFSIDLFLEPEFESEPIKVQLVKSATLDDLLDAIEWVESKGNANAIGDNGEAVGAYQIHKIYVRDVNRILGKETYTYEDRWNRDKSREMTRIYLKYYDHNTPTDGKNQYPFGNMSWQERLARIHNGGPQGYKKESTEAYWEKVKRVLND